MQILGWVNNPIIEREFEFSNQKSDRIQSYSKKGKDFIEKNGTQTFKQVLRWSITKEEEEQKRRVLEMSESKSEIQSHHRRRA